MTEQLTHREIEQKVNRLSERIHKLMEQASLVSYGLDSACKELCDLSELCKTVEQRKFDEDHMAAILDDVTRELLKKDPFLFERIPLSYEE